MEKIVIIGSPGAGKTTLARELGPILKIKKVIHLDRLFWKREWKGKTGDIRIDILNRLVQEKRWIIEGTYLCSSGPRLEAADTIIFLDTPPLVCLQRIIKRHREYRGHSRRDIPEGCNDKLTLFRMLKVLVFPLRGRRKLEKELRKYNPKQIPLQFSMQRQPMRLSLMVQAHRLRCCLFLPGSEVRLQGCSSGEIRSQRFDIVWLRRVNLENDRIARWNTLVG